jgi:hypothetical protein
VSTAVLVLIVCAAIDLAALGALFAVVWVLYRRMRKGAAAQGEALPSAAGQFGCFFAAGLIGFGFLYGIAYLLLRGVA